jgi:ATP-dependent DNA helicase RecG
MKPVSGQKNALRPGSSPTSTGSITAVWFKRLAFFRKFLAAGDMVVLFGNAKHFGKGISIVHPEIDKVDDPSANVSKLTGIVPVYPGTNFFSTTYITSNVLRKWVKQILNTLPLAEFIPGYILEHENLPVRNEAYRMIHFPESNREHRSALRRFKFEELFLFELSVARLKQNIREKHTGPVLTVPGDFTRSFFNEVLAVRTDRRAEIGPLRHPPRRNIRRTDEPPHPG